MKKIEKLKTEIQSAYDYVLDDSCDGIAIPHLKLAIKIVESLISPPKTEGGKITPEMVDEMLVESYEEYKRSQVIAGILTRSHAGLFCDRIKSKLAEGEGS